MGLTRADRDKRVYSIMRKEGLTHEEIVQAFSHRKEQFIQNLQKSPFEAHFGMRGKTMFLLNIGIAAIVLIVLLFVI